MSKYTDLINELNEILRQKQAVSKSRYGLIAQEGKEAEWNRLNEQAAEIRRELREVRYGSG